MTPLLPTKFRVNVPFGTGERLENRISRLWQSWVSELIFFLSILDLQVTSILPIKFWVHLTFGLEEIQNRFSRWRPWQPYWISDRNYFSYFDHSDTSYRFGSMGLSVQTFKIDFQNDGHKGYLGFLIGTKLFLIYKTPRYLPETPIPIAILNFGSQQFKYFSFTGHPDSFYQVSSPLAFRCRRISSKEMF